MEGQTGSEGPTADMRTRRAEGVTSPNAFNHQLEKKQAVYPVVHVLLLTLLPLPSLLVHAVRASLLFDSRSGREKGTMGEKNA